MNLFKRKKVEKTISKPLVIIIEVSLAVIIFLCAIGLKWLITNRYNSRLVKLENQVVNNFTFSDCSIEYSEDKGTLKVNVINYTEEVISTDKVTINLYAKNNTLISQIELPNKIILRPNEKYLITTEIATDVRAGKVEYKIGE